MKRNLPLLFLIMLLQVCCFVKTYGQNLVLNPSFENYTSCPQGISEFSLCTNWSTTTTASTDTCSTPDLYEACSPAIGGVNVPNALLGYHTARTGTGFAGIILGDGLPGCVPTGDNYREYIEGQLSSPLVAGTHYKVIFYASLAEDVMWGSNSLGVYFTNTQYTHAACPNPLIAETPQLEMCGPAIMDTVNWIPVEWIYVATGGEKFFTIGNFKNDANTNHVTHNCGSFNPYIYYYIDDMSITPAGANDCGVSLILDSVNSTCGTNNGVVSVRAFGCTSPFTYAWSNSSTDSTNTNVGPGQYTVTVTDNTNCHETASISVNSNVLSISTTGTNPACGGTNGAVTATVSNGTGPYTYLWSNGATTATVNNLGAGSYYVTVNGASGCLAHDSVSLLSSSGLTLTPSVTGASCGSNNGSATANVTGGSAPYTFTWSNGQTSQTATNLAAGNYSVTVLGDTSSGAPFWTENFTSGGTGWTLNTAGTNGPNGNSNNQWVVNSDNTCVCGSGNYLHITNNSTNTGCLECIITPAGTCQYLELASTFGEGDFATDVLAISPIISTLGKSNIVLSFNWESLGTPGSDYGLVDLSNNGGTTWTSLPFQYVDSSNCSLASVAIPISYQNSANFRIAFEWINGAGSLGNAGNPPGFVIDNIALTAASANCPATANVTVPSSGGLNITLTPTSPSCGLNNGAIAASVTGSGTLTYTWNNGSHAQTLTGLGTGAYSLTVTSNNGCSATASTSLFVGNGNISALTSTTSATCGSSNGSATVTASGASGYTYSWSNGGTAATITGVAAGNYTVTVSATSGGCTASATADVVAVNNLELTPGDVNTTCGNSNGSASVTITSGTGPYSYTWSNGSTTSAISNLASGTYGVTVSASGGCTGTASAVVAGSTNVAISSTTSAAGCAVGGSATVNVTAGSGPFSYVWSNGATSATVHSLSAGNYSVTVTGAAGCSASTTATVAPSDSSVTLADTTTASSCRTPNGAASVTVLTGSGPYIYAWSNGSTANTIFNVAAGPYVVTVTGASGCSATAGVTVPTNGTVTVTTTTTNTSCGNNNGSAYAVIGGNLLSAYTWSNGATTDTISNLASGTYDVTVVSAGGCSVTATAVVNPSGGTFNLTPPGAMCMGDTAQICAPSGYVSYHWNNGSTAQCINTTQAGNYYVTVVDNGNCTATSNHVTLTVNAPSGVSITEHGDTLTSTGAITYQWYYNNTAISGATAGTYLATQDGNYYVQVTDGNGCKDTSNTELVKGILGINQLEPANNIKIYPNPLASGNWHLDVSSEFIGASCEFYDAAGRLVYKTEIRNLQSEFELLVAQGVYLMRINSAQKSYTFKLIKL